MKIREDVEGEQQQQQKEKENVEVQQIEWTDKSTEVHIIYPCICFIYT